VTRLTPPIEHAGQMPQISSDAEKAPAQEYANILALVDGAVGIPFQGNAKTLPSDTRSARLQFTTDETRVVVQKCKARNLSASAAVHASIAAANYVHAAAENKGKHYTSAIASGHIYDGHTRGLISRVRCIPHSG
jgi:hypothetical protein